MSTTEQKSLLNDFTGFTPEQKAQLEPIGNLMAVTNRSVADLGTIDKRKIVERCINDSIRMEEMLKELLGMWERKEDLQTALDYVQKTRKTLIETLSEMRPEDHDPIQKLLAQLAMNENSDSGLETKLDLVMERLAGIQRDVAVISSKI